MKPGGKLEKLIRYLVDERKQNSTEVAEAIWADYQRGGRSDRPDFLKPYVPEADRGARKRALEEVARKRQARHLTT